MLVDLSDILSISCELANVIPMVKFCLPVYTYLNMYIVNYQ